MSEFAEYISTCHRCRRLRNAEPAHGFTPCPEDGVSIIEHAKSGLCPIDWQIEPPPPENAEPIIQGLAVTPGRPRDGRGVLIENRPAPTLEQIAQFAKAAMFGKRVPIELKQLREGICPTCEYCRVDDQGVDWCSLCGCGVSDAEREIRNLAAYAEARGVGGQVTRGCKHPRRGEGKGWHG